MAVSDDAPGLILRIDRDRHLIRETPQIKFLRRESGIPDLFLYEHAETKAWVVCRWVNQTRRWAEELYLVESPAELDQQVAAALRRYRNGQFPDAREYRQQLLAEERANLREWDAEMKEAEDAKDFLRRRIGEDRGDPQWECPSFPVEMGALRG